MDNSNFKGYKIIKDFLRRGDYDDDLDNYICVGMTDYVGEFDKRMSYFLSNNKVDEWITINIYNKREIISVDYQHRTNCICGVSIKQNCFIHHKDNPNIIFIIGNICRNHFEIKLLKKKCNCGNIIYFDSDLCGKCNKNKTNEYIKNIKNNSKLYIELFNEGLLDETDEFESFVYNYLIRRKEYIYVPYELKNLAKGNDYKWNNDIKKWSFIKGLQNKIKI